MKLNKIAITMERTVQMRQFEPATIRLTVEAQIDPTDNENTVIENLKKKVRESVDAEEKALKQKRKANFDDELEKSL